MTKAKRKRTEYSPAQKAAAMAVLASCGGHTRRAARQLKEAGTPIPEATIRGWTKQPLLVPAQAELIEEAKRELDTILEGIASKLASGLDRPEAIARLLASPVQGATVLGITVDKLVALRKTTPEEGRMTLAEFLATAKGLADARVGLPAQKVDDVRQH